MAITLATLFGNGYSQSGNQLHYRFQHIEPTRSLAGSAVLNITQDDKGFIWIATLFDGIQRYDGVRFERFGDEFLNTATNIYNIRDLDFVNGKLIATSDGNFFRYNYFDKKFHEIQTDDARPSNQFYDKQNNH